MGPDGQLDEAASVRKQAESYAPLAQRMRDIGAPPKSADEYAFEVPEALKDKYDPKTDPMLTDFRAKALEAGLSPKQFQAVMSAYAERVPLIAEALFDQRYEAGERALRAEWKTDQAFTDGLKHAAKAVKGFDPAAFGANGEIAPGSPLLSLMNNPFFLRFAAHFGAQLEEDTSPGGVGAPAGSPYLSMTIESLEGHEAYMNARHPDHALVSRMVQQHYLKKTGERIVA
jgi:hypothetical protein